MNVSHLTQTELAEAALAMKEAQRLLRHVTTIVKRAPFTDRTLSVMRAIQEDLIDPLREAWDAEHDYNANPYPSVGYSAPRPHRKRSAA